MVILAILAMCGGLGILAFLNLPKERLRRVLTQGLGAVLFTSGLLEFMYSLVSPIR